MRLIPVDYKSIQPKKRKDYANLSSYLDEFMHMNTKSVEVMWTDDDYTTGNAAACGFARAIKKSDWPIDVKVYNGNVYLIRKDLEYTPLVISTEESEFDSSDDGRMEISKYARLFDSDCCLWVNNRTANLTTLRDVRNYANYLLETRGHLFLNEVYDLLGLPRISEGQLVGWVYNVENPVGDNFVEFTVISGRSDPGSPDIIIDFNVDGDIMMYID